jgi:hypothetical protein
VVVCGAILGVAGFAVEQAHANWRPHVTRTALGWQASQPHVGIDFEPALAGDHLAWQAGPYTLVMDLSSGKVRLVGAGGSAQSVWPVAATGGDTVWAETSGGAGRDTTIYAYDFATRRRQVLLKTAADLEAPPVAAGSTAYWLSGTSSTAAVTACDISGGRRRVLAVGSDLGPFLLADDSFVVWSRQPRPSAPFAMTVLDTASGATSDLTLPDQSSGAVFDTPILANGTLAWLRIDKQSAAAAITSYDLRTLAAREIVGGPAGKLVGPGFDGATVVWAQPADGGSGDVVMGLRLSGGPAFRIAVAPGDVSSVMVSGSRVAWWVGTGPRSWIETARLPR